MSKEKNKEIVWSPSDMVEVKLKEPDDFLMIKESLTRIGLAYDRVLYQTCHILHKQGRYFITHFKELMALDGREVILREDDIQRRNRIVSILESWGKLSVVDPRKIEDQATLRNIKILSRANMAKEKWKLETKYIFGPR